MLGDRNAFADVESVTFYCNRANPAAMEMKAVATLEEVRILHLEASSIHEADLRYLARLHNLDELSLTGFELTAESAKYLVPLHQLGRLKVSRTLGTDVEAAIVRSIPISCSITKGAPCQSRMAVDVAE
jgi:hypothetical protein